MHFLKIILLIWVIILTKRILYLFMIRTKYKKRVEYSVERKLCCWGFVEESCLIGMAGTRLFCSDGTKEVLVSNCLIGLTWLNRRGLVCLFHFVRPLQFSPTLFLTQLPWKPVSLSLSPVKKQDLFIVCNVNFFLYF